MAGEQVVSAGVGYGILVWDLMADAAEDLSDFVDRLIEQRAAVSAPSVPPFLPPRLDWAAQVDMK